MKKICICIISALLVLFSSCSLFVDMNVIEIQGLENFDPADSENGITEFLLPCDLLTATNYQSGDYYYFDNCYVNEKALEKSLVYLIYDDAAYAVAKEYCLNKMELSAENVFEYQGYVFAQNTDLHIDFVSDIQFPYHYLLFGYNDDSNTLLFTGLYCGEEWYDQANQVTTDFKSFWNVFYSKHYDLN